MAKMEPIIVKLTIDPEALAQLREAMDRINAAVRDASHQLQVAAAAWKRTLEALPPVAELDKLAYLSDLGELGDDEPTVCTTHLSFWPCRHGAGYTSCSQSANRAMVAYVRQYHDGSLTLAQATINIQKEKD